MGKQCQTLFFWAPKSLQMVTAAMKLKDTYSLGRKVMTNLDSIFKSRDITLPTKVHLVKAMVFPVVMYGCESWSIKKSECQRIDAFELCCWRRLLRVPWTARRSNQSILKEISSECWVLSHLTCLLRNPYAGQEATVRTGHGTTDWFQIGKEYVKAVYCHPAYLTYMQSTSRETLGWKKHKLESRLLGEIPITSDMQMTVPLWQKVKKN